MMRVGSRRHRRKLLPWLAALMAVAPMRPAAAETSGTALLVGIDDPAGKADHACDQAAHDVGARLREQGIAVQSLTNPSAVELRSAIDDFAAGLEGAAPAAALVYVCGPAVAAGSRLFVMPPGADPDAHADLASQGIVVQAFLNALAGTGGTVFADLGLAAPADEVARARTLRVPSGLHLALNLSLRGNGAWVGRSLASTGVALSQGWDAVAAGIAAGRPADAAWFQPPPATLADAQETARRPDPANAAPAKAAPSSNPSPAQAPGASEATPPAPRAIAPAGHRAAAKPAREPHAAQASASIAPPAQRGTWPAKLPDASAQVPTGPVATPAETGRIERLQAALARKDFYQGPISGRLDPYTQRSVQLFQRSLHAPETGALTQAEIIRLLNE